MDSTNRQAVKNWLKPHTKDASLTSWRQPFCNLPLLITKWLPPWRKGRITCVRFKSVFDCLTIGIIHEIIVVQMTCVIGPWNVQSGLWLGRHTAGSSAESVQTLMLPAWWALWLLWWPLTDAAMFQCVYGYLQSVFFFLVLFHCCILLEIKLTTTTTTWVWTFYNNYSNHPRMCVLSTLCGNVDKHSPFDIYIYIYIHMLDPPNSIRFRQASSQLRRIYQIWTWYVVTWWYLLPMFL